MQARRVPAPFTTVNHEQALGVSGSGRSSRYIVLQHTEDTDHGKGAQEMTSQILTAVITGIFSLVTGLASIWLKDYLERRRSDIPESKEDKRESSTSRAFLLLLFGLILGAGSRSLRGSGPIHYETILALAILAVATLVMALHHRQSKSGFWPFQLELISLWFAFTAGWSLIHGSVWSDLLVTTGAWWIGSAFVGGIIVASNRD